MYASIEKNVFNKKTKLFEEYQIDRDYGGTFINEEIIKRLIVEICGEEN